jgi:holin-like protein
VSQRSNPAGGSLLKGFSVLLMGQVIGEGLAHGLGWPIPGPVLGMLGLLCALVVSSTVRSWIGGSADALLAHLSLLFVPAGVGVVLYLHSLASQAWKLALVIVASTWIGLIVTAWVAHALLKASHRKGP